MSTECSTEYHTSQQSDNFEEEQPNSQTASGDVTTAAGESGSIQNQEILHNNDSQASNATTITLSSPSQEASTESQDSYTSKLPSVAEKECQTMDSVFLSADEYASLLAKASFCPNFSEDLIKIRFHIANLPQPEMDPTAFEQLCRDAGAKNLYSCINDAICSDRMSSERRHLSKLRTMVVIYIMIYSQSQRSNAFQVALSRTLQQFGISEQGLQSLRNLGIAAHPHTVKAKAKLSSASHSSNVASFIESAVENEQFLIFCIDDYHNIHTMHRPESKKQTNAIHMSTLLIKVFPNIKALCQDEVDLLPKFPVDISSMKSKIF